MEVLVAEAASLEVEAEPKPLVLELKAEVLEVEAVEAVEAAISELLEVPDSPWPRLLLTFPPKFEAVANWLFGS